MRLDVPDDDRVETALVGLALSAHLLLAIEDGRDGHPVDGDVSAVRLDESPRASAYLDDRLRQGDDLDELGRTGDDFDRTDERNVRVDGDAHRQCTLGRYVGQLERRHEPRQGLERVVRVARFRRTLRPNCVADAVGVFSDLFIDHLGRDPLSAYFDLMRRGDEVGRDDVDHDYSGDSEYRLVDMALDRSD